MNLEKISSSFIKKGEAPVPSPFPSTIGAIFLKKKEEEEDKKNHEDGTNSNFRDGCVQQQQQQQGKKEQEDQHEHDNAFLEGDDFAGWNEGNWCLLLPANNEAKQSTARYVKSDGGSNKRYNNKRLVPPPPSTTSSLPLPSSSSSLSLPLSSSTTNRGTTDHDDHDEDRNPPSKKKKREALVVPAAIISSSLTNNNSQSVIPIIHADVQRNTVKRTIKQKECDDRKAPPKYKSSSDNPLIHDDVIDYDSSDDEAVARLMYQRINNKKKTDTPPSTINDNINSQDVYQMCRKNQWISVLDSIKNNPLLPSIKMKMKNNILTTILHQAITSQGDIKDRTKVIEEVLSSSSCHNNNNNNNNNNAAQMRNGNGSLPLHCIAQRSVKFDYRTKEMLIRKIMNAYPKAVSQQGGIGKRTPLHIIFTGSYLLLLCVYICFLFFIFSIF
jgi:hypothetical protein